MNKLYECVKEGNPHPVVSALVIHENKVLMILRGKGSYQGYWALPGGMIDRNEQPEKAVLRELEEETGIIGKSPKILTAHLVKCNVGLKHTSIDVVYRVYGADTLINSNKTEEVLDIKFFPFKKIPKKIAFGHRAIITNFKNN